MIIYRPHRGNLYEAMDEAQEFENELAMKQYIFDDWSKYTQIMNIPKILFSLEDIVIGDQTINDERIGWEDTRYVCLKRLGDENYIEMYGSPQCIGMCATKYKPLDKKSTIK